MTLEQLRIFLAVAEREHLTQAAAALHLTPSAVSSALRSLEHRYGVPLFDRVGRGIELTEAGRIFQAEAKAVLARAEAAELALSELGGLQRGTLAVQASQTIASYWVPRHLLAFRDAHPGIGITLAIGNTQSVARAVLDGDAELGLVEGELDEPALFKRVVAADSMRVVVAPSHPWADGRPLAAPDLAGARWIRREPGSGTRAVFQAALAGAGVDVGELDVALELPSNEAVQAAVEAGGCAAVLSQAVVAAHLATGRLVAANFPLAERAFTLVRHKERHPTQASLALETLLLPGQPTRHMRAKERA